MGAAALLAKVRSCTQISRGKYRTDDGARASVPVCGLRGAVFWKADLDIDCDGRESRQCNKRTDPYFQPTTAYQKANGQHLNPARLPYVVVPLPAGSGITWRPGFGAGVWSRSFTGARWSTPWSGTKGRRI